MAVNMHGKFRKRKHAVYSSPLVAENARAVIWTFCGALLPALIMSVYFFGMPAVHLIFLSVTASFLCDVILQWILRKPIDLLDGKAVLIGLLSALCLPSTVPFIIPIAGAFIAIAVAKHLLARKGYPLFHPALFSRAVLLVLFPGSMSSFSVPAATLMVIDAKTTATPLMLLKQEGMGRLLEVYHTKAALYIDLLLGNRPGSLGETSAAALLLGAGFLMIKRYISWHIPVSFIATVGMLMWMFGGNEGLMTGDPVFHMLSGGLILGAFFFATDHMTSPSLRRDQILFGIACGALTTLIRLKGGYPEGVLFAILIMNCFTPLLDQRIKKRIFTTADIGELRNHK